MKKTILSGICMLAIGLTACATMQSGGVIIVEEKIDQKNYKVSYLFVRDQNAKDNYVLNGDDIVTSKINASLTDESFNAEDQTNLKVSMYESLQRSNAFLVAENITEPNQSKSDYIINVKYLGSTVSGNVALWNVRVKLLYEITDVKSGKSILKKQEDIVSSGSEPLTEIKNNSIKSSIVKLYEIVRQMPVK